MLRYEMDNLRNQDSKCDTYASMKKEVELFHETLSKGEIKSIFDFIK